MIDCPLLASCSIGEPGSNKTKKCSDKLFSETFFVISRYSYHTPVFNVFNLLYLYGDDNIHMTEKMVKWRELHLSLFYHFDLMFTFE